MMNMLKSKRNALIISNVAGMISGMCIGYAAACSMRNYMTNRNSLRNKAKKAFRTIEKRIPL